MFLTLENGAYHVHHESIVPLFNLFEIVQLGIVQLGMIMVRNGRFPFPSHLLICKHQTNQHIDKRIMGRGKTRNDADFSFSYQRSSVFICVLSLIHIWREIMFTTRFKQISRWLAIVLIAAILLATQSTAGAFAPVAAVTQTAVPHSFTDPAELESFLDEYLAAQMAEHHIPGAVVTFVKDGEVFLSKG